MKKTSLGSKGFGVVGILAGVLVLTAISGAGFYMIKHKEKIGTTPPPSSTVNTQPTKNNSITIASADGKVKLTLPKTWHVLLDASSNPKGDQVISESRVKQVCIRGTCSPAPCLDIDNPTPCVYEAVFQPKNLSPTTDQSWGLRVEKTTRSIAQTSGSMLGDLTTENTVEKSSNPINGYNALYVKTRGGDPSAEHYVDVHYFIQYKGHLLHFSNREQYSNHSQNPIEQNYSSYTAAFSQIVHSLQLNL